MSSLCPTAPSRTRLALSCPVSVPSSPCQFTPLWLPWCFWRAGQLSCWMSFSLGLTDAALWLERGYAFVARTPHNWWCVLLSALSSEVDCWWCLTGPLGEGGDCRVSLLWSFDFSLCSKYLGGDPLRLCNSSLPPPAPTPGDFVLTNFSTSIGGSYLPQFLLWYLSDDNSLFSSFLLHLLVGLLLWGGVVLSLPFIISLFISGLRDSYLFYG